MKVTYHPSAGRAYKPKEPAWNWGPAVLRGRGAEENVRAWQLLVVFALPLGVCRSREAFLYSCAPADTTRAQRINHVMTLGLFDRLHDALDTYAHRCGGYPAALHSLLDPPSGARPDCRRSGIYRESCRRFDSDEGLASWHHEAFARVIATGADHGYQVRYQPSHQDAAGLFDDYQLTADPLERDKTGFDSYWMSSAGNIRWSWEQPASAQDPPYPVQRRRPTTR
jgi:hypothetical protein